MAGESLLVSGKRIDFGDLASVASRRVGFYLTVLRDDLKAVG